MKVGGEYTSEQDQGFVAGRSYEAMREDHQVHNLQRESELPKRPFDAPADPAKVAEHLRSFDRLSIAADGKTIRTTQEVQKLLQGSLNMNDISIKEAYAQWLTNNVVSMDEYKERRDQAA